MYCYLKKVKTNDTPAFNAMLLLGMPFWAIFFTIYIFIDKFTALNVRFISDEEVIILGIIFIVFNYFYLYRNLGKIIKKHKNESKNKSIIGCILLALYFFGSFIILFYLGVSTS